LLCFSSLIFEKLIFLVDVRYSFGLQETQATSADARPDHHSKLGASQFLSRRITRSCVPLMPAPAAAAADPAAANTWCQSILISKNHTLLRSVDARSGG
jgi:hypothetical protein